IRRMGGRSDLFAREARAFRAGYENLPAKARLHSLAGEPEVAMALMHTLKGVAGTLGALHLSRQAAALEDDLRATHPGDDLAARFDTLALTLIEAAARLEDEATRLDAAVTNISDTPSAPMANIAIQLAELLELLEQRNMRAISVHASFGRSLHLIDPVLAKDLDVAIDSLDFVTARQACLRLQEKCR
ncbi:hypothetical protein, partial [uncultured Nevskia sp.]|uniref:Hpt domain-containing protein n=1 Tax=uncultured Nevskia sp. TaxID=228950 RepID=UPI0025E6EBE0